MPPSPTILKSPVFLFLGAGASAPLDRLLMQGFIEHLEKALKNTEQASMLNLLTKFRGSDLEAIMGELDTLVSMNYSYEVSGTYKISGAPVSFSLKRSVARQLSTDIKHQVIRQYRYVDTSKTVELFEPLFESLFSKLNPEKECLVIFTTNYDPAIEVFCQAKHADYHLCDGFEYHPANRDSYWDRSVFDQFTIQPNKRNIVLFKMHGSVDWLKEMSSGHIHRGQAMYDALDSDAYSNVLIYPATRKIATSEPYYSGYEYYQRCCEAAQACIAIGYSFRDYDALTRLRGASSVNPKFQLALASPDAERVLASVPIPAEGKVPLPFAFGIGEAGNECLTKIRIFLTQVSATR